MAPAFPAAYRCPVSQCGANVDLRLRPRLFRHRLRRGDLRPVPAPEAALAEFGPGPDSLDRVPGEALRYAVGTPDEVRDQLAAMAAEWQVEELMIVTVVHDPAARLRSYELLASACGLRGR